MAQLYPDSNPNKKLVVAYSNNAVGEGLPLRPYSLLQAQVTAQLSIALSH